jgi:hypothetical protein
MNPIMEPSSPRRWWWWLVILVPCKWPYIFVFVKKSSHSFRHLESIISRVPGFSLFGIRRIHRGSNTLGIVFTQCCFTWKYYCKLTFFRTR